MKRTTGLLAALLLYAGSFAQSVEQSKLKVTHGPNAEYPKGYEDAGYLGNPTDGMVQICFNKLYTGMLFQPVSPTLAIAAGTPITYKEMGGEPREMYSIDFQKIGGKYYWFYATYNKKGPEDLYMVEIDTKTGKRKGDGKKIITKEKIEYSPMDEAYYGVRTSKYVIRTSADSSKVLVTYRYPPKSTDDTKNIDVIGMNVFDANMKPLWNKDVTLPYTEEMMDNKEYTVDRDGNAYLLAKVYAGNRKERTKDGTPNYRHEIIRIQSDGSTKKIPIKLDNYFMSDFIFTEQPKGGLLCAGFYSLFPNSRTSNGAYVIRIDKDGNIVRTGKTYYEFPSEILGADKDIAKPTGSGNKDEDVNLIRLKQVLVEKDGGLLLAGEGYNTTTRTGGNGATYTVNYYGNTVAMKIDASGEMKWCRSMPKYQVSSSVTESMSFSVVPYKDSYYFFYTDNAANLDKIPTGKPASVSGWGGWLVYSKIDADGKVTKAKLFEFESKKARMQPRYFGLSDPETVIARGYLDNSNHAVSIKLE